MRSAPASRGVTLFLEALRDGRSGYLVHRSPLGVRAPSGSFVCLVSGRLLRIGWTTSTNLGSPSETLPGTAPSPLRLAASMTAAASSCETDGPRLLPWTSVPVQRSRRSESDARPDRPGPAPSPPGVSHALRGFILTLPCHRFQVADAHRVSPSELSSSQVRAGARHARWPSSTFLRVRCRSGCPLLPSRLAASPRDFGAREAVPLPSCR